MDFELDLSSENMTSFLELEQEIKEATTNLPEHLLRPSVIVKPRAKPAAQPSLTDIMTSCGIEYELPEECNVSSPSSIHSGIQLDQNQELIEELEEFFIKTEGPATVVDENQHQEELSLTGLNNPLSSSLVTPDGQNVIIIIAPSSPPRVSPPPPAPAATLTPSGRRPPHLSVRPSSVFWRPSQSRPKPGRSTPGPSRRHLPPWLPTRPTRRRGRKPRTVRPPSGTARRRRASRTWQRRSSRLWLTRTASCRRSCCRWRPSSNT